MNTPTSRQLLRRVAVLGALFAACAWLIGAVADLGARPAQAADAGAPGRGPASPLITIYTDTYEVNNFQNLAFSLNPGFPYGSIQCATTSAFTDIGPLIDNASFWQYTNPAFDTDWYNIELAANYFFTISVRNKDGASPIAFNVQLRSPSNTDVPSLNAISNVAPDYTFYTSNPGKYQLGLAIYNAASVSTTENYPYQIYICSSGPVAPTPMPTSSNTPTPTPVGPAVLVPDTLEPNNTITEAQTLGLHANGLPSFIAVGQTIPGLNFHTNSEPDYVYFYGRAGSTYEASTESVQPGVETTLAVYLPLNAGEGTPTRLVGPQPGSTNPNNRWVTGARGSKVTFTAPQDGLYWLLVTNSDLSPRTASQTYSLKLLEILPATPTPTATAPTPTPFAGVPDRFEYDGSFDNAALLSPGLTYDSLNFVPINPSSASDTDNDYYKIPVKQGVYYTCETDNLGGGADTNMIVYNGDRVGIGGNDDISALERSKGNFRSRFSWLSSYTGVAYVLVGQVNPTGPAESGGRTYSFRCMIGLPNTSTPLPTNTPLPGSNVPYVPPTPLPPEPTFTPYPTNRPSQNLVFRPVDLARAQPTATVAPAPRSVVLDVSVFSDQNKNLANDLNEGIGAVSVRINDEQSGAPLAQIVTDAAGRARVTLQNDGPVRVSVPVFGVSVLIRDTNVLVNVIVNAQPEVPDRLP